MGSIRAQGRCAWQRRLCCLVMISACALIVADCAKRIPEPAGGHTGVPHIGWVIMSGDAENPDRDFACQSNPRSECVLPVDRPEARVMGHVHVYYHAASTETKYSGSIRIGFFDQAHEINPSITVNPGASPGNESTTDFVASRPGTYTMTMAVIATSTRTGEMQNIRDQVTVVVR